MANISVDLFFNGSAGQYVPGVSEVPVVAGDGVAFTLVSAAPGPCALHFSPGAAANLSPSPGASVTLAPGQSTAFAFATNNHGDYAVIVQAPELPPPADFGLPAVLAVLRIASGQSYLLEVASADSVDISAAASAVGPLNQPGPGS